MCGRAYATFTDEEIALRYFHRRVPSIPKLSASYNISPTQAVPVLRKSDAGELQLDLFRWQFVPPWEPEFKTKLSTINAKSETVFTSRLYRDSVLHHRCIVPLSGFYEWKRDGERKRPFAIHLARQPIMSLAGIWTSWPQGEEHGKGSFAILTTSANGFMQGIHDRMPVILDPKDEDAWLDPKLVDKEALKRLLKPCPEEWLDAHEISTLVNSPRNNTPEILTPVVEDPANDPVPTLGLEVVGPRSARKTSGKP